MQRTSHLLSLKPTLGVKDRLSNHTRFTPKWKFNFAPGITYRFFYVFSATPCFVPLDVSVVDILFRLSMFLRLCLGGFFSCGCFFHVVFLLFLDYSTFCKHLCKHIMFLHFGDWHIVSQNIYVLNMSAIGILFRLSGHWLVGVSSMSRLCRLLVISDSSISRLCRWLAISVLPVCVFVGD